MRQEPSFAEDLSNEERFWLAVLAGLVAAVVEAALLALLYVGSASGDPILPKSWPFWLDLPLTLIALAAALALVALTVAALAIPTYKLLLWALDRAGWERIDETLNRLHRLFY